MPRWWTRKADEGDDELPSADRGGQVTVTGGRGIVVGEHNVIYQYFSKPGHAAVSRSHVNFSALIADKTRGFVGREFIVDSFDQFLEREESGYFLVLGEPGIGKTALAAHLVQTRGYPHHFNVAQQNVRTARQFLANGCAQLIARYDLPYERVPDDATGDSTFLVECLEQAVARADGERVVLVVDSLDESDVRQLPPRVNALFLPPSLPAGAYVFVTSRPLENLRLRVERESTVHLDAQSNENLADIATFLRRSWEESEQLRARAAEWSLSQDELVLWLTRKSEGNFVYLHYVLPAIEAGRFRDGGIEQLPTGLLAYYREHWDLMQIAEPVVFDEVYAPIVCLLAVAREPLSADHLRRWTSRSASEVLNALGQWREFLDEVPSGDSVLYRIYHSSFQDFLATKVDLKRYDAMIADYYLRLVEP
jgi:serine/threonine-protein kinase